MSKPFDRNALLPRMMVGPHEYVIDLYNGELRSIADPTKTIDVFKMEKDDGVYSFWYNSKEMKMERLPADDTLEALKRNLDWVHFEPWHAAPEFYNRIAAESKEAQQIIRSGNSHYEKPYDQRESLKEERMPKLLPMVNIYGTEFFLDVRLKEFRQVDAPHNIINYNALSIDEFHHILLFDTTTKNAFAGTYGQARQTDTVKQIILPPLDLMILHGVKRHEAMLTKTGEFASDERKQTTRSRRKGIGF